jgi:hypothetical protein
MGLLDDAIREHLELKRLHGADPGQVAREALDALGPVERTGSPESQAPADVGADAPPDGEHPVEGSAESHQQGFSHAGQETTELDMTTVLGESSADHDLKASPSTPKDTSSQPRDSLEWEMPDESASTHPPEEVERSMDAAPEPEDVLEETPDFLRDTPEQERLWFEQRPPRDFDFDK